MKVLIVMNVVLLAAIAILVWDFTRTRTKVMGQFNEFTKRFTGLIEENKAILSRAQAFHESTIAELQVRRKEFDREVSRVVALLGDRGSPGDPSG